MKKSSSGRLKTHLKKCSVLAASAVIVTLISGCGGSSGSDEAPDPQKVEADKQKLMKQGPPPVAGAQPNTSSGQ